jgi:hypothetical protein
MRYIKITLFTLTLFFAASAAIDTSQSKFYMYTYFVQGEDEQSLGARLALSNDGVTWDKYNDETPIIVPAANMVGKAGGKPLMRDPNVYLDPNTGVFHLTWTTQWEDDVIGYAYSKDLIKWSTQIKIPVGHQIKNCGCCWAPEFFYDDTRDSIMVTWSTDRNVIGKEAFCSFTKDFKTYSYPVLYFEPTTKEGVKYSIIDETILKVGDKKYYLFYKDERTPNSLFATQNIHCTFADNPKGPWWKGPNEYEGGSNPITAIGTEGPTAYIVGDEVRLVSDPFKVHENTDRIKTAKVSDLMGSTPPLTWSKGPVMKTSAGQNFLPSHGSIAEIPKAKVLQLLYKIPDPTAYPKPWVDITANDIVVQKKSGDDPDDDYPLGPRNWGCGDGAGLALIPPIFLKGWASRRRKKQNTKTK